MMLAILAECWHHEVLTPLLMPLLRARHRSIARPVQWWRRRPRGSTWPTSHCATKRAVKGGDT